jgi:hypothetical protein
MLKSNKIGDFFMKKILITLIQISTLLWGIAAFSYDTIPMDPYGLKKDQDCRPIYLGGKTGEYLVEVDRYGIFRHKNNQKQLEGEGRFVMDGSGNIFYISGRDQSQLTQNARKSFFHSSFFDGGPVAMAGYLEFGSKGNLVKVNNESGHYRPTFSMIKNFDDEVKKRGIRYKYEKVDATVDTGPGWDDAELMTSNNLKTGSELQKEQGDKMMILGCKLFLEPRKK